MEKADNTTPSCEELAVYVEESIVSVTNTYEQSPVVLMVDDAVIGTLGNFSASIGKAKSKKTFNVSAIVASALRNSTVLHYRSTFPDNKRNILYIDTEQGRHHCQQILKRILRLAELPEDKKPDNLLMLALRKFSPKLRLAIVEQAIGTIPDLGLVIIDGIRISCMTSILPVNLPISSPNSCNGRTTDRFTSIQYFIKTKMMNMLVVTSALNSTIKRKPSCRSRWIKRTRL